MIVVRVELHSAITRKITEIARVEICNIGAAPGRMMNYAVRSLWGRSKKSLDSRFVQRTGQIEGHRSRDSHVLNLVAKALFSMGYGERLREANSTQGKLNAQLLRNPPGPADA